MSLLPFRSSVPGKVKSRAPCSVRATLWSLRFWLLVILLVAGLFWRRPLSRAVRRMRRRVFQPPAHFPDGIPSAVCLAWRGVEEGQCSPTAARAPHLDRDCDYEVEESAAGFCEVLDIETTPDGAIHALGTRQLVRKHCYGRPRRLRCSAAVEFSNTLEKALSYQYPTLDKRGRPQGVPEPVKSQSRGIAMSVFDSQMVSVYASIRLLREHGCRLPIELWFFPGEIDKCKSLLDDLVQNSGCTARTITAEKHDLCRNHDQCFAAKGYVLFHSSFDSVLLLDTDNFAVRDPTYLFDSGEFLSTGAIFWPDFWHPRDTPLFGVNEKNLIWELLDIDFQMSFEQESGQVLVDRKRHARALQILMFLMQPLNLIWKWELVWGDKDLFRLAMLRAGEDFHFITHPPASAGPAAEGFYCGVSMLQFDPAGIPAFVHRNSFKIGSPSSLHYLWDVYSAYKGDNPWDNYRTQMWNSNDGPIKSWLHDTSCFGRDRKMETLNSDGWQTVQFADDPYLAGLETKILRLAQVGFEIAYGTMPALMERRSP